MSGLIDTTVSGRATVPLGRLRALGLAANALRFPRLASMIRGRRAMNGLADSTVSRPANEAGRLGAFGSAVHALLGVPRLAAAMAGGAR